MSPGVRDYINEMYAGQTYINLTIVPPGWSTQPQVYQKIYRPYCGSCHSAQTGPLGFRSWGDVVREKLRVKQAVCEGTMPHAEVPFQKLWTDGGAVLLPGYLLAALGYSGC